MRAGVALSLGARAGLAALASALVVLVLGPRGAFLSWSFSLPLLVLAGGWLAGRVSRNGALALLLATPPLAVRGWRGALAALTVRYADPTAAVDAALHAAAEVHCGVPGLLLGGALALRLLRQPGAGVLAAGAFAAASSRAALVQAAAGTSAAWALVADLAWLAVPALAVRRTGPLRLLLLLVVAWTAGSPLDALLAPLPQPAVATPLPEAAPGPSPALPALPTADPDSFLDQHGYYREENPTWACGSLDAAHWLARPRATVALALPPDTPITDLDRIIETLRRWSVQRLVLVGRAEPPAGPLGPWLAWPGVSVYLDAPPPGATAPPPPGEPPRAGACVLQPAESATVGAIYAQGGRCEARVLLPPSQRQARATVRELRHNDVFPEPTCP